MPGPGRKSTEHEGDVMSTYPAGTALTCNCGDCNCRIVIENECHCANAGEAYRCTCGCELVPAK